MKLIGILALFGISLIAKTSGFVADTTYQQHYDQDPVNVQNEGAGGDAEGGSVQMTLPESKIDVETGDVGGSQQGLDGRIRNTLDEKISIDIRSPEPLNPQPGYQQTPPLMLYQQNQAYQPSQQFQPYQQFQPVQPIQRVRQVQPEDTPNVSNTFDNNFVVSFHAIYF